MRHLRWMMLLGLLSLLPAPLFAQLPLNHNIEFVNQVDFDRPGWIATMGIMGSTGFLAISDGEMETSHVDLFIYDLTAPSSPTLLQRIQLERGFVDKVLISGSYVILSGWTDLDLFHYDPMAHPETPLLEVERPSGVRDGGNAFITDNYLVVGGLPGIDIVELREDITVDHLFSTDRYGYVRQVQGRRIYTGSRAQDHVDPNDPACVILDFTNPRQPVEDAEWTPPNYNPESFMRGAMLYDGLFVHDYADPMHPVSVIAESLEIKHVRRGLSYGYLNGVHAVAVTDPSRRGRPDYIRGLYFLPLHNTRLTLVDDYIYVVDALNSMFTILRYTGPQATASDHDAAFTPSGSPAVAASGSAPDATGITFRNTGIASWSRATGYRLRVASAAGAAALAPPADIELPEGLVVRTGESCTFQFAPPPGLAPGDYALEATMQAGGVGEFGETATFTLGVPAHSAASAWTCLR